MKEKKPTWAERHRAKIQAIKKRKVFEEYQTPYEEMLDAVIEARGNNPTVIPQHEIHFTPGIPTEDGWYVVKVTDPRGEYYAIAQTLHGILVSIAPDIDGEHEILSHAKLPEL